MPLRVGLDFDNTIVRYDDVFHRIALELNLVPADLPRTKGSVRDYLRRIDREDEWTKLQGYVYGARMADAAMFPGVMDFLAAARGAGVEVRIISHKTRSPYLGPPYDLHQAALDWIRANGFYDPARGGLRPEDVFFELTKEAKLKRIGEARCGVFLDDLPEFLAEPGFPASTERVLFDPAGAWRADRRFRRVETWSDFSAYVLEQARTHG